MTGRPASEALLEAIAWLGPGADLPTLAAATGLDDDELRAAQAALLAVGRVRSAPGGRWEELEPGVRDEAVARLEPAERIRLATRAARHRAAGGDFGGALDLLERAIAAGAGEAGLDGLGLLVQHAELASFLGASERAATAATPAAEVAEAVRAAARGARAARAQGRQAHEERRWERAEEFLARSERTFRSLGIATAAAQVALDRAEIETDRQRADDAAAHLGRAVRDAEDGSLASFRSGLVAARIALVRADEGAAARHLAAVGDAPPAQGPDAAELAWTGPRVRAALALATGSLAEALAHLERAASAIAAVADRLPDSDRRAFLARDRVHPVFADL